MAELEYDLALLERVAHELRLRQRAGETLLAVDVLARFHRVEHHLAVPVVRRGDDHGLHLRIGEQVAVIHVGFRLRIEAALDALLAVRPVNIAHGHDLDAGHGGHSLNEVPAACAQADAAHADRLGGRLGGENRGREAETAASVVAVWPAVWRNCRRLRLVGPAFALKDDASFMPGVGSLPAKVEKLPAPFMINPPNPSPPNRRSAPLGWLNWNSAQARAALTARWPLAGSDAFPTIFRLSMWINGSRGGLSGQAIACACEAYSGSLRPSSVCP